MSSTRPSDTTLLGDGNGVVDMPTPHTSNDGQPRVGCTDGVSTNKMIRPELGGIGPAPHRRGDGSEEGGLLFICGMAKNNSIPVSNSAIDTAGDCCYFTPVLFPFANKFNCKSPPRFVSCAADMQLFAALGVDGNLWGWGIARSALPQAPICLIDTGDVVAYDVGAAFVVVALQCGRIVRFSKGADGLLTSESFTIQSGEGEHDEEGSSLKYPVHISAAGDSCAVVCSDGTVWTMGPCSSLTTGHVHIAEPNKSAPHTTSTTTPFKQLPNLPPIAIVSIGSRHAAAVSLIDRCTLYVWGDGLSGNLGLGKRIPHLPTPTPCTFFKDRGLIISSVSCTKGQREVKRVVRGSVASMVSGQEGPRMHVVTLDGGLWIAGTTHKGLGGDHLNKVMQPVQDHLTFYRVGSAAADAKQASVVPTGAAEDLGMKNSNTSRSVIARRMGMENVDLYGKDGITNYLSNVKITASQPAHIHSWALSECGRLFTWGCGSDGRLGLQAFMRGPGGSKRALKCYVSTPSCVETFENGHVVVGACAGRYWTLAIVKV